MSTWSTPITGLMVAAVVGVVWIVGGLAHRAQAQPGEARPPGVPGPDTLAPDTDVRLNLRLGAFVDHTFKSRLRGGPGEVGVTRSGGEAALSVRLDDRWRFGLNAGTEHSWYNFRGAPNLIPGTTRPVHAMHRYDISPTVSYRIDEQWSVAGGGLLELAHQGGASVGDSFTGGGLAAVRYAFSKDLALSGGLLVKSRLEDDAFIVPILGIEWQITEQVRFETRGLGGIVRASLNEQWTVRLDGGYETREYRLDRGGFLPSGVFRDRRVPVGVGVEWTPTSQVTLGLRAGLIVWQEYLVDNRQGVRVSSDKTRPAAFLGLSGSIRF
jgi:hypothetical protein